MFFSAGVFNQSSSLSKTAVLSLDQRWRISQGLPMNANACGVLTDGPDYTFLDGRLTPYGMNQKKRIARQREVRDQIIHLSGEIDFAVDRHKQKQIEEKQRKQNILDKKLKPKGMALLKSK